jgi:hypothetical protein
MVLIFYWMEEQLGANKKIADCYPSDCNAKRINPVDEEEGSSLRDEANWDLPGKIEISAEALWVCHYPISFPSN